MVNETEFISQLLHLKTQNEAFKKLVLIYQKPLYFHIRNIVLNHDDADDVLQNTFVKVFQNLSKFKAESKLFSWIYRIATNEAITHINLKAKRNGNTTEEFQQKQIEKLTADIDYDGDEIAKKTAKSHCKIARKTTISFQDEIFSRNEIRRNFCNFGHICWCAKSQLFSCC